MEVVEHIQVWGYTRDPNTNSQENLWEVFQLGFGSVYVKMCTLNKQVTLEVTLGTLGSLLNYQWV